MFCNQCEQTTKGIACTKIGICGKNHEVAALQDVMLYAVKGLSIHANQARQSGIVNQEVNRFTLEALFSTLTNVNFDPERFLSLVSECVSLREKLGEQMMAAGLEITSNDPAAKFIPADTIDGLVKQGEEIGFLVDLNGDPDIASLQELVVYGLKGVAAYAYHAAILGQEDEKIYEFTHMALARIGDPALDLNGWLNLVLQCGEINLRAMELLDAGNTGTFGHPIPTEVPLGHKAGKCILVSGHDLKDLKDLLEATKNTGITIYTHGEMLPAHGYPELKKYPHLYGNYGSAWQNQKKEFANFPGAILMTTNCIQEPQDTYRENIFTTGPVGWPGVRYVENGNFAEVIAKAQELPGFNSDEEAGSVMVGFARNTVMSVADQIIAAVKSGDLKHIFLVGGCDGAKSGRNYFTDFVEQ
ncbi:MAG: hybrid cluster protein, partial [Firmicutes bacterium]|nr:hybrid cluster protein [Bacillota bacterium]